MNDIEVKIAAEDAAMQLISDWATHAIAVCAKIPLTKTDKIPFLWIYCHDIEEESTKGLISPSVMHVKYINFFVRKISPPAKILIHCVGGNRRSPAFAVGLYMALGDTFSTALAKVLAQCPNCSPNRLALARVSQFYSTPK